MLPLILLREPQGSELGRAHCPPLAADSSSCLQSQARVQSPVAGRGVEGAEAGIQGPVPHRVTLLMTSCSAPCRDPRLLKVSSEEEEL